MENMRIINRQEEESGMEQEMTYNEQYPPSMFTSATVDLAKNAVALGLAVADDPEKSQEVFFTLNRERYMKHIRDVETDGMKLQIIPEQTKEMCLAALYQNVRSFPFIINQDEELCEYALNKDVSLIGYIRNQTPKQILYVLNKDTALINQIHNKADYYESIIKMSWKSIAHIKIHDFDNEEKYFALVKLAIDECGEPVDSYGERNQLYKFQSPLCFVSRINQDVADYAVAANINHFYHLKSNNFAKKEDAIKFITEFPCELGNIQEEFKVDLDIILLSLEKGYNGAIDYLRQVEGIKYTYSLMKTLIELSSIEVNTKQVTRRDPVYWKDVKRALGTPNILYCLKTVENLFPNDYTVNLSSFPEERQTDDIIKYFLKKNPFCFKNIESKNKKAKYLIRSIALGWVEAAESRRIEAKRVKELKASEDALEFL